MSIQTRSFGSFSNMQSSMSMADWYNEADSQFDAMATEIVIGIGANVWVLFPHGSAERIAMTRQLHRLNLWTQFMEQVEAEKLA